MLVLRVRPRWWVQKLFTPGEGLIQQAIFSFFVAAWIATMSIRPPISPGPARTVWGGTWPASPLLWHACTGKSHGMRMQLDMDPTRTPETSTYLLHINFVYMTCCTCWKNIMLGYVILFWCSLVPDISTSIFQSESRLWRLRGLNPRTFASDHRFHCAALVVHGPRPGLVQFGLGLRHLGPSEIWLGAAAVCRVKMTLKYGNPKHYHQNSTKSIKIATEHWRFGFLFKHSTF